jgi:hypothetical protein
MPGTKKKPMRKASTKKPVKKATDKKRKSSRGKPRGASDIGKYSKPLLKEIWNKARKEGREPTKAERSKAFKEAWAKWRLAHK